MKKFRFVILFVFKKTQLIFYAIATDNGAVSRSSQAKISIEVTDSAYYYPIWKPSDNCKDQKIIEEDLQVRNLCVDELNFFEV